MGRQILVDNRPSQTYGIRTDLCNEHLLRFYTVRCRLNRYIINAQIPGAVGGVSECDIGRGYISRNGVEKRICSSFRCGPCVTADFHESACIRRIRHVTH